MGFRMSAGKAALSAVIAAGAVLTGASPAAANGHRYFLTYAFGNCDTATGEWVVDWQLINPTDSAAEVTNAVATPAEWPIQNLPASVDAGATVHATQRLAGTPGLTSSLYFTARWADGATYPVNWSFRPRTTCKKAA